MLKPDTFHEHRLLGFPPGVSAYLITFNRFHNYVAGELKRINEGGRFTLNPRYGNDAERQLDHDLFNVARLSVLPICSHHPLVLWSADFSTVSRAECMSTSSSETT